MIFLIIYLLVLLLELIFFASFAIFTFFLIYSSIKGSAYVPTNMKEINSILKLADLKKGQIFIDLGCGDGRVVREAVKQYCVHGIGLDVNILLIYWARLITKLQKLFPIEFKYADMNKNNLPQADVIYIFLFPKLIDKITPKLLLALKKSTLIISHGFKVKGLNKFLKQTINHQPYPTYFYKL